MPVPGRRPTWIAPPRTGCARWATWNDAGTFPTTPPLLTLADPIPSSEPRASVRRSALELDASDGHRIRASESEADLELLQVDRRPLERHFDGGPRRVLRHRG